MKISLKWLQKYFDEPLPSPEKISDALTFHAFEIEAVEGDMIDVKVLPNRAADCLSHRGLAKELSAILDVPLKEDPLRTLLPKFSGTDTLTVTIKDPQKCMRYIGAVVRGVKVGPSPLWLREALEAVGQRSINNIVDATNYVMLDIGQPLPAFDGRGVSGITGRDANDEEKMTILSGEEYALPKDVLLITDVGTGEALGIAGVKGGKRAEISDATTDIIVESANFDGTTVRRAAQVLKLFTDASLRFQNRPSPELAAYGMHGVLALITELAGGEVIGVVDEYPYPAMPLPAVSVSLAKINGVLGSSFAKGEVQDVFKRLGFEVRSEGDIFTVTPPFERTDIVISEDLVEEVGRIIGYDKVPSAELPSIEGSPDQARYHGIERMKDQLIEQGFTEVSTQSFAKNGDIMLANPLDKTKPALRTSLEENLREALEKGKQYAPLILLLNEKLKLFEIGTVFPREREHLELRMTERVAAWGEKAGIVDDLSKAKLEDHGKDYTPKRYVLGTY